MNLFHSEEAVSQVMAVALMVAVTALLAGVVASFCLSATQPLPESYSVGATAERINGGIAVAYYGGQDAHKVHHLNWTINGVEQTDWLDAEVGANAQNTTPVPSTRCRVTVAATFTNGAGQVILDTTI
ncbi:type IV pilin [Methanofollis fontis]|nr:type IV pilin N-terminal domain-containing protein [Methanofollis fontis]